MLLCCKSWSVQHVVKGCVTVTDVHADFAATPQAVYTSAVTKAQYVREATLADAAEAEKLLQRQSAAKEQYDQGLAKLRATSRQLQSLASRVRVSSHPGR